MRQQQMEKGHRPLLQEGAAWRAQGEAGAVARGQQCARRSVGEEAAGRKKGLHLLLLLHGPGVPPTDLTTMAADLTTMAATASCPDHRGGPEATRTGKDQRTRASRDRGQTRISRGQRTDKYSRDQRTMTRTQTRISRDEWTRTSRD